MRSIVLHAYAKWLCWKSFFFSNVDTYVELLSEIMIFWFYRSLNICINIRNAMASDTS